MLPSVFFVEDRIVAIKSVDTGHITVIGLGNMGSALAERLLATEHMVTVWNRSESKCAPLVNLGATVEKSPANAVNASSTILVCVLDIEAVRSILESEGVADALAGKTVIQLSALEPEQSREQGEWMSRHQARYLDGGILGFPTDVRDGAAKIAYSGSKEVFEDIKPILDSFGPDSIFVGEKVGMAPLAAMLIYARYYGITFACMHTVALAVAAGIPANKFLDLTSGDKDWQFIGQVMDEYIAMTGKRDYSTSEATLEIDASGYDYFVRLSQELGVDPRFHEIIESVLSTAIEQGRGDQAIPAIFEVLSGRSGS
jgi:3-hydroxyisobutyrate dehydrogenase-like beta-hydroxyacid dehydrogenase